MAARGRVTAEVTADPIDPAAVMARVGGTEDGAVLLFLGTVRNHADGRPVSGLRYEAYEAMAADVLACLAREVADEAGVGRLHVVHRVGELAIGDVSVAIAASSPHREEAYAASRAVIEGIKARLPVWKKERYADGDEDWVPGRDPRDGADDGSPASADPTTSSRAGAGTP